jgi:Mrp family chromosome partitioning ATPase
VTIVALAGIAAVLAWTVQRPRQYRATVQVLVTPQAATSATSGLAILDESVDPTRTLQTAATMLTSPQAAAMTARQLGDGRSVAEVRSQVAVEPQGDTNAVGVTASAGSPQAALRLANVYTDAALRSRGAELRRQVAGRLAAIQGRARALGQPGSAVASALADQADALASMLHGHDPNFSLLQGAVPTPPRGKSPTYKLAVELLAALGAAVGVGLVAEAFNRRVRDEQELTGVTSLGVLARVPLDRHDRDAASVATEALGALQIHLETPAGQTRTVLITSPSRGDGKSTVALALARALAAAERRVVVIDLDRSNGDLRRRLGVPGDHGPSPASGDAETVERVDSGADLVLIDAPPIGTAADALLLATRVDDVLLVVRPGHTTRRDLAITRQSLQQLAIVPTGLILVGARPIARTHIRR